MARSVRSVAAGGTDLAVDVAKYSYQQFADLYSQKLYWFLSHGYQPHPWQASFHAAANEGGRLVRFRHLVAGRRGGKTMSAAWETLFYALHPEQFHQDAHSVESSRPLWIWGLTKDHEVGRPARIALQEAINTVGLVKDKDYRWNRTEKTVSFLRDEQEIAFLQWKSADDPQSLRGAGLDLLWLDEAAFIPSEEAWDVVRPALSDKMGLVITTTTPHGKNWFHTSFWSPEALVDPRQHRVEYTSIDRPNFHKEEWDYAKKHMHPSLFKQEYVAAFDALSGLTLDGDWLRYYTLGKAEPGQDLIELPRKDGRITLRKYLGVDPSTGESKDEFAICCLGITEDGTQGFLLDLWHGKIQFPEQIDKIREWHLKYRPELIGIESNAYQRSLAQQANRLQGFPGIVPVMSRGNKNQRIVSMSPIFKIGKVRLHKTHSDFVDQWVSFDGERKDNRDDLLDSVEIALGVAGVMLPMMETTEDKQVLTFEEEAMEQIRNLSKDRLYDMELGVEG